MLGRTEFIKGTWIVTAAVLLAALLEPPAEAAEFADEGDIVSISSGVMISRELKREKRAAARRGNWAWTVALAEQVGYTSNLYASPEDDGARDDLERSSNFIASSFLLRGERRFTPDDTFKMSLELSDARYSRANKANDQRRSLEMEYEHEFSRDTSVFVETKVKHQNDSALDVYGHEFKRDFGYYKYSFDAGVSRDIGRKQKVKVLYSYNAKDYNEVSTRNSLDWSQHGPSVRYRLKPAEGTSLRVWYDFRMLDYSEELASTDAGAELAGNPEEEHHYQKALIWLSHDLGDEAKVSLKYRYKQKDDRFEDYESYAEHGIEVSAELYVIDRTTFEISAFAKDRQYDHRPGETVGEELEYDKWGIDFRAAYQRSRNVTIFGGYSMVDRDTNRETGSSYMDYVIHVFGAGVSVAF